MSKKLGSDWESLQKEFYESFPEMAAMKSCSSCRYATWANIKLENNQDGYTPYCSEKKIVLETLIEADNCNLYDPNKD